MFEKRGWLRIVAILSAMTMGMTSARGQPCCSPDPCCSPGSWNTPCCLDGVAVERAKSSEDPPRFTTGIGIQVARTPDATEMSVISVTPGGPAEAAGIVVGDEILGINGTAVGAFLMDDLTALLRRAEPIRLKIRRDEAIVRVEMTPVLEGRGGSATAATQDVMGPKIGDHAPDTVGEDTDGVPFKLSDYRGKVVVLDFWAFW